MKEQSIWQRRFFEHVIRDEIVYKYHLNYIHYNPVKHGYVDNPTERKWASFHWFVRLKWYDPDLGEFGAGWFDE